MKLVASLNADCSFKGRNASYPEYVRIFLIPYFILFITVLTASESVYAQKDEDRSHDNIDRNLSDNRLSNLTCIPPSAVNYSSNSAFYCTNTPITPNVLSYQGSPHTSILISPDLPVGLSFNTTNGTITGTPTVPIAGNYTVIVVNPCGSTSKVIYIAVSSGTNYYSDFDGDGFGAGLATVSCSGQPVNTSTNNTDCAPTDPTKWRVSSLYFDQDGDRYTNGFPPSSVCFGSAVPTGRVLNYIGTDCFDSNPLVNPNASEILGNNIDDNCDGMIDEVIATSSLMAGSCGAFVPTLSTMLYAQPVSGAQGYRFEVTTGPNTRVFETSASSFRLLDLSIGSSTSTTSTRNFIRVSVKTNGFWRAYGSTCIVDTATVPNSTSVSQPTCGSYLTDIWNSIYCYQIPNATGYRFRVKKDGVVIGTVDRTVNSFTIVDVGINNLVFATAYTIDVLLKFNDTWLPDSDYGISCVIVTPPTPGVSRITMPSCGSSTSNTWQIIYAIPITGAQGYKFVFNNGIRNREYITPSSSMSISNIPGGVMPGTTYTIRVDVLYNNSYVEGRELCTLTLLPASPRLAGNPLQVFELRTSPNPFGDSFGMQVNTSSEAPVEILIYDMFGRVVEQYEKELDQIGRSAFGQGLPSGVYQVTVNQGDNSKTVRVIKR